MFYDSETRQNIRSLRFGIVIIVLFLMSAVKSCTEIKYSLFGEITEAKILRTAEVESSRGQVSLRVKYRFKDLDGKSHDGLASVDPDEFTMPEDRVIQIIYLPGSPRISALASQPGHFWTTLFLVMSLVFTIWMVKAVRDVNQGKF